MKMTMTMPEVMILANLPSFLVACITLLGRAIGIQGLP